MRTFAVTVVIEGEFEEDAPAHIKGVEDFLNEQLPEGFYITVEREL